MSSHNMSRRGFVLQTAIGVAVTEWQSMAASAATEAADKPSPNPERQSKLHVVCVGAHPDDPESGCGGTLARYAELGHRVTNIYLTRGEAGIAGKSYEEAAAIRTAEAEAACRLLGAKAVFASQIDGATELNDARTESFLKLFSAEAPDVVLAHWPIDAHPDHQIAGILTIRAYLASDRRLPLFFFEVCSGIQTLSFTPTAYVDISGTREKKKAALFVHKSQGGEDVYREHHQIMDDSRGREAGVDAAEAYVPFARGHPSGTLPGL